MLYSIVEIPPFSILCCTDVCITICVYREYLLIQYANMPSYERADCIGCVPYLIIVTIIKRHMYINIWFSRGLRSQSFEWKVFRLVIKHLLYEWIFFVHRLDETIKLLNKVVCIVINPPQRKINFCLWTTARQRHNAD